MSPLEESKINPLNNTQILCIKIKKHIKNNGFYRKNRKIFNLMTTISNLFCVNTKPS